VTVCAYCGQPPKSAEEHWSPNGGRPAHRRCALAAAAGDLERAGLRPATVDPMAGKVGRPRSVAGENDDERSQNRVWRAAPRHDEELDALIAEGKVAPPEARNRSGAIRWLIEQSAKRRKRRGK
jgi:hypothetical protein